MYYTSSSGALHPSMLWSSFSTTLVARFQLRSDDNTDMAHALLSPAFMQISATNDEVDQRELVANFRSSA